MLWKKLISRTTHLDHTRFQGRAAKQTDYAYVPIVLSKAGTVVARERSVTLNVNGLLHIEKVALRMSLSYTRRKVSSYYLIAWRTLRANPYVSEMTWKFEISNHGIGEKYLGHAQTKRFYPAEKIKLCETKRRLGTRSSQDHAKTSPVKSRPITNF